jgi:hypothetical protein
MVLAVSGESDWLESDSHTGKPLASPWQATGKPLASHWQTINELFNSAPGEVALERPDFSSGRVKQPEVVERKDSQESSSNGLDELV